MQTKADRFNPMECGLVDAERLSQVVKANIESLCQHFLAEGKRVRS